MQDSNHISQHTVADAAAIQNRHWREAKKPNREEKEKLEVEKTQVSRREKNILFSSFKKEREIILHFRDGKEKYERLSINFEKRKKNWEFGFFKRITKIEFFKKTLKRKFNFDWSSFVDISSTLPSSLIFLLQTSFFPP